MKVLGVVCSPRKGGNTEIMMSEALASAAAAGAEVEMVGVAGKNLLPCDGCGSCLKTAECKIQDDMQALYPKLLEADGIIFGTPVYYWSVTAQAKIVIDRTYVFRGERKLRNKIAGTIVVAARAGVSLAFSVFSNFYAIQRMVLAVEAESPIGPDERGGGAVAYSSTRGGVRDNAKAMAEAASLGRNMVRTIKAHRGLP